MNFDQYLKRELENDSALRAEFDALQPEYEIIRKLIETRIKYGLTQKELARKCGIKQSNISRLESGKSNPTIRFLQKIAKAMDLDLFIEFHKRTYSEAIVLEEAKTITCEISGCESLKSGINSSSYKTERIDHYLVNPVALCLKG